jgi:hypothetical protein
VVAVFVPAPLADVEVAIEGTSIDGGLAIKGFLDVHFTALSTLRLDVEYVGWVCPTLEWMFVGTAHASSADVIVALALLIGTTPKVGHRVVRNVRIKVNLAIIAVHHLSCVEPRLALLMAYQPSVRWTHETLTDTDLLATLSNPVCPIEHILPGLATPIFTASMIRLKVLTSVDISTGHTV